MGRKLDNQLVSILVITYNTEKFVLETLESTKAQTYQNIELIISDDGSSDKTTEICSKWLKINNERFSNIKLITSVQNTGPAANCNRALKNTRTKWVKFIAGDDILLPNCIEDNMLFIRTHPEVKAVFSQLRVHEETFNENNFIRFTPAEFPNYFMHPKFTAKDQYKLLLQSDRITYTPSFFFNKQVVTDVGGFDETNRLVEDYPMWLKLTQAGVKLHYFHKPTVCYRIHKDALNNTGEKVIFKPSEINNFAVRKKYAHPHLPWAIVGSEKWTYRVSVIFKKLRCTRKSLILNGLYSLLTVYLNPFVYIQAIQKRIFNK